MSAPMMSGPDDPPSEEEIEQMDFTPTETKDDEIEKEGEPGGANFA